METPQSQPPRLAKLLALQSDPLDIPYIDPSEIDHAALPAWLRRFPLFFTIELVNRGVCVYCVQRFLRSPDQFNYLDEPFKVIHELFQPPHSHLSTQHPSFIFSTSETTASINSTLGAMSSKLLDTSANHICTICLNIMQLTSFFTHFLATTVQDQDYEFNTYQIQRTFPSSVLLKQFGMWHYLKHQFGEYIPYLKENPTTEGTIMQIKEALKLHLPTYTDVLNKSRAEMHAQYDSMRLQAQQSPSSFTPPHDFHSPLSLQPSLHAAPTQSTHNTDTTPISTLLPTTSSLLHSHECNFITSKYHINKDPITFDLNSPFKINIMYYTTSPDYSNALHNIIYQHDLIGEFSTNSVVLKKMSSMGLSNMKLWCLSPPTFTDNEAIPVPKYIRENYLHELVPESELALANEAHKYYTPSFPGVNINRPVPYLPKQLLRWQGVNEFLSKTFVVNKYLTIQIGCSHDSVYYQGFYRKESRMLSQTSWYRDLSFYHFQKSQNSNANVKDGAQVAQIAPSGPTALSPQDQSLLSALQSQVEEEHAMVAMTQSAQQQPPQKSNPQAAKVAIITPNTTGKGTSHQSIVIGEDGEVPVFVEPKRKRHDFTQLDDEVGSGVGIGQGEMTKTNKNEGSGRRNNNNAVPTDGCQQPEKKTKTNASGGEDAGSDADEVVSLHELDPIYYGEGGGDDTVIDSDEDDDGDGFGAQLMKTIQRNKHNTATDARLKDGGGEADGERGDAGDTINDNAQQRQENQGNKQNAKGKKDVSKKPGVNEVSNDCHEDDNVGQGSLPYAESSLDNELCLRILPYYHPINAARTGPNVLKHVLLRHSKSTSPSSTSKTAQNKEETMLSWANDLTEEEYEEFVLSVQSHLLSPVQRFGNSDTTPPGQKFGGYCSIHSTNPNGIPCTHYHREALPGPIDKFYTTHSTSTQQPPAELKFNPYRLLFHALYSYKFHSSGREDLNVRMLGGGRLFALEICDPHRIPKDLDCEKLRAEINAHSRCASLVSLQPATIQAVNDISHGIADKRKKYRCVVHTKDPITAADLADKIETLGDVNIIQNTPVRVFLRRAALPRPRHINNLKATYINPHFFYLDLETQAGTYVKEFVHSDKGRTKPSITSILGTQCDILQLDVMGLIM